MDVSDPQLVFELYEKLRTSGIFLWNEVEQFCERSSVKTNPTRPLAISANLR